MAIEKVKEYFKKFNMDNQIIETETSSATVELAAKALGCEENKIAKSLGFLIDNKPILIVVSGNAKIDNHKFKEEFKTKAKMISYDEVEKYIGHAAGGVCPFAVNEDVTVYLDKTLQDFSFVYPACGSSNSAIKLAIPEIEKYSNYKKWIDVCKEI